jgi:proton-dependent oligopeptide transporter, POT family
MGAWFLGMGVSLYAGGAIAGLASIPGGPVQAASTLPIYTRLFFGLAVGALVCAIVATAIIPMLNRMIITQEETGDDPAQIAARAPV